MFNKGSEWRRWELHIHTPNTKKNDQYQGSTLEEKWDNFYKDINDYVGDGTNPEHNISAIAITDYVSIENYKKVRDDKKLPECVKLLLANVELRIEPLAKGTPINIHCIFSPDIVDQLDYRFFSKLKLSYRNQEFTGVKPSLVNLGRMVENNPSLDEEAAYRAGIRQFVLSIESINDVFTKDDDLRKKTIIVVSNSSQDGVSGITEHVEWLKEDGGDTPQLQSKKESIYWTTDAIFSPKASDIKFFSGQKQGQDEQYIKNKYRSLKPCFHGSDAHINNRIFTPDGNKYCWIKADVTFEGLLQTLIEPKERVYIGQTPAELKHVQENPTKYIKRLYIDTVDGMVDKNGKWFEKIDISLNSGLVSIIGNKGSGKSAIVDIIGLIANTDVSDNFSFLSNKKFNQKGLSNRFYAQLEFNSGNVTPKVCLNQKIEPFAVPLVKYIPQSYFETICNEIGKVEALRKEIEKVVYQYIPENERLGKTNFDDLLSYKKANIEREIDQYKLSLSEINREIIIMEDKMNPEYKKNLELKLDIKKKELEAHEAIKPIVVAKPGDENNEKITLINKYTTMKQDVEKEIQDIDALNAELNAKINDLKSILSATESEVKQFKAFKEQYKDRLGVYDLNIDDIINIEFNSTAITDKILRLEKDISLNNNLKDKNSSEDKTKYEELCLNDKLKVLNNKIEKNKNELSASQQNYQTYIDKLNDWEKRRSAIIGAKEQSDTIKYYETEIQFINEILPNELEGKRSKRLDIVLFIYNKKREIKEFYDEIKSNISQKLNHNNNQDLSIDSLLDIKSDFIDNFMQFIAKNKVGSFKGINEGSNVIREMLLGVDMDKADTLVCFLKKIICNLEKDINTEEQRIISNQVSSRERLYDYLFSLDYIYSHYELRQNGKNLDELSPGEKGALLLVFYLLLDMNDIPLVIDQPEDNLDNNSVAKVLVPFIREAKKRRQIIMVTHNPNLAVVADAEQVIYVNIDKKDGNKFSFSSGSIENSDINKNIVNILEGTYPAFSMRKDKYFV